MLRNTKLINIILLMLCLLVSGCATNQKLEHSLDKNSRIAVVANFRDVALFQRAGTTSVDNASFYRAIPKFNMTTFVTTVAANDLYRTRQYKVIPIYHHPDDSLLSAKVQSKGKLTAEYKSYLTKLVQKKKVDEVVLITPGDIDFGDGQYLGAIWWATGYGIFNRAFIFMQTNTIFAAYNVYVVEVKTGKVLAKASGDLQTRSHNIDIAWHKGYAGVSSATLQELRTVLRKKVPASLVDVIHKTGLP